MTDLNKDAKKFTLALNAAAKTFTSTISTAIQNAQYKEKTYENGSKAKEALIRSQTLIGHFHEALKQGIYQHLQEQDDLKNLTWQVHPPLSQSAPELKIFGALKGKTQDVVFTRHAFKAEKLLHLDARDAVGYQASNHAIVCGVRSQMSSVDKNFDTLMERAIAEAVNLRIRLPQVTLVELYIIPLKEIDEIQSRDNLFQTKSKSVNLKKFIRQFYSTTVDFSHLPDQKNESYMMHATCLLILDLENEGRIIENATQLADLGYDPATCDMFKLIQPDGFYDRIIQAYRHNNASALD